MQSRVQGPIGKNIQRRREGKPECLLKNLVTGVDWKEKSLSPPGQGFGGVSWGESHVCERKTHGPRDPTKRGSNAGPDTFKTWSHSLKTGEAKKKVVEKRKQQRYRNA